MTVLWFMVNRTSLHSWSSLSFISFHHIFLPWSNSKCQYYYYCHFVPRAGVLLVIHKHACAWWKFASMHHNGVVISQLIFEMDMDLLYINRLWWEKRCLTEAGTSFKHVCVSPHTYQVATFFERKFSICHVWYTSWNLALHSWVPSTNWAPSMHQYGCLNYW